MKTLYELLGVCPEASDEALKKAYRRLAKIYHPDLNANDPDAARKFRQITAAIRILCDAKRRAHYDQRLARELQRRHDREMELRRAQWQRIIAVSVVAAAIMGGVVVMGSVTVRPVSPTPVVSSRMTYGKPAGVWTAGRESVGAERSKDTIQTLAETASAQVSTIHWGELSVQPRQPCQNETGSGVSRNANGSLPAGHDAAPFEVWPGCRPSEGHAAEERELSANEGASLIRQAQVQLASGDTKGALLLLERACRGLPSRCSSGPGARSASSFSAVAFNHK